MIKIISIKESEKWNEVVKNFKDYDIYYLSEYVKAFQIHGDGEPILFYYEGQEIKALNVVMKRDIAHDDKFKGLIPENKYFDITTPYGYGGFLIEGEISEETIKIFNIEYSERCKNEGIVSEFVRFHPVLNNKVKLEEVYDISTLGKTITMNIESQEKIWENLISKNRNIIRKAKKSGVEIFWGRDPGLFERFIELYNATMDKDNAKDYYYFDQEFYLSILKDLKYSSMIFYAVYKGEIIATSIIMFSNNKIHYHLSASDRKHQNLAPSNLLLYEVACWGCENGYKTFHLGGGLGSKEDNLYKFKKAFNRNPETHFSIGRKVFDEDKYKGLLEIISEDKENDDSSSFFPLYRL